MNNVRGRKLTTGNYDTREKLIQEVIDDIVNSYLNGNLTLSKIARIHGISFGTLSKIWDEHKPELKFIDHKNGGPRYEYSNF